MQPERLVTLLLASPNSVTTRHSRCQHRSALAAPLFRGAVRRTEGLIFNFQFSILNFKNYEVYTKAIE